MSTSTSHLRCAAGSYFFEKRLAGENQASIYVREGWKGTDDRLIDAKKLSADQNTSVSIDDISRDGSLLVYGVRQGGADEESVHVIHVRERKELPDVLPSARYVSVSLAPEDKGIYYSVFTHQGTNVYFHRFGTAVQSDSRIFGGAYHGEKLGEIDLVEARVSDNDRYLLLDISHGVPPTRNDILVKDLRRPGSDFLPLVYGIEARTRAIDIGNRFFLETDYQAANKRIVEAVPGGKPEEWKTIIPEAKDVIEASSIVGGKLFVTRLHDVKTETAIYTLDGHPTGTIHYPAIGSSLGVYGLPSQNEGFYSFESFIQAPTIFRYDTRSGNSEVFAAPKVPFDTSQYEVTQVFYTSKDGTRVPMFIAGKKGLQRNGQARLLMTGYGGFDVPMLPEWDPAYAWWMEQGGFSRSPTCAVAMSMANRGTRRRCSSTSRTSSTTSSRPPSTSSPTTTRYRSGSHFAGARMAVC